MTRWAAGAVVALAELLLLPFLAYDSSSRSWGYVAVDVVLMAGGAAALWALWSRRRRRDARLTCDHCGAETVTVWIGEDEMWREFNGGDDGIACTDCFVRWALARDILVRFRAEVVSRD